MPKELKGEAVQELVQRMRRIEGQARGIQRMLAAGEDCEKILVQLSAMRAALGRVGARVLQCNLEAGGDTGNLLDLLSR